MVDAVTLRPADAATAPAAPRATRSSWSWSRDGGRGLQKGEGSRNGLLQMPEIGHDGRDLRGLQVRGWNPAMPALLPVRSGGIPRKSWVLHMTLSSVLDEMRHKIQNQYGENSTAALAFDRAMETFQADPEFTLPARIAELANEYSYRGGPGPMIRAAEFARRLRELR